MTTSPITRLRRLAPATTNLLMLIDTMIADLDNSIPNNDDELLDLAIDMLIDDLDIDSDYMIDDLESLRNLLSA